MVGEPFPSELTVRGSIAIVGMACRYADARNPRELWENVLAGRRAFRRIPDARLRLEDYWSADRSDPDRTYVTQAAVLTDFEFDRVAYRVSASSHRAADPAHWLALDCAAEALRDAGWTDGKGLSGIGVGVLLGNTLTGDYSRAAAMRLRWPYVRRVVSAALLEAGLDPGARSALMNRVAESYRQPFPVIDDETLAGWLSNTIAGRICNYFGFHGGGYAVDGACASSLLAVTTACSALTAGDLDVAMAGGVDLSLDPFELVGFARAGALAGDEMRVFDRSSNGFWPGEGCGFLVLMREADARAAGRRIYGIIRGWGVSSDGPGGLTRPEVDGQMLALDRTYRRAGYGIDTVAYFEGHGTGTAIGDQVELTALTEARRRASASTHAVVGSIKANIGHTKAAAGVAGIIKATMAVHRQVLPPTTGCAQPRPELVGPERQLAILDRAMPWPAGVPLRASVSAMGFGGINAHITLEGEPHAGTRLALSPRERQCMVSAQDAELIALAGRSAAALLAEIERYHQRAATLSRAELTDLAVMTQRQGARGRHRVAMIACDPEQLRARLERAAAAVRQGETIFDPDGGLFVGHHAAAPRIAFVFPGQGSPTNVDGGAWSRRFAAMRPLFAGTPSSPEGSTHVAQVAIARAALAGLRLLNRLSIHADVAVGHSLGELVALHWGHALDEQALLRIVDARGAAMAALPGRGAMASIAAEPGRVSALLNRAEVCIAAYNGPQQTVVAGQQDAVASVIAEARREGLDATLLNVGHAFHSELMRPATPALRAAVEREAVSYLARPVISTVTGAVLSPDEPLAELLVRQVVAPVRFTEAAADIVAASDLAIEIGPGTVLSRLLRACGHRAVVSTDAGGASIAPLLIAVGAAYVAGAGVRLSQLASGRFARRFDMQTPRFLVNPCEQGPVVSDDDVVAVERPLPVVTKPETVDAAESAVEPLAIALEIVAARAELPLAAIRPSDRLLADLHFNSITAVQIILDLAARLEAPPPSAPSEYADASIEEVVQALTAAVGRRDSGELHRWAGVDAWVRYFRVTSAAVAAPLAPAVTVGTSWEIVAPPGHPLLESLQRETAGRPGGGIIACLPSSPAEDDWLRLSIAARDACRSTERQAFVVVHDGSGGAGIAFSVAQEAPNLSIAVVQVPFDAPAAAQWILDEAVSTHRLAHIVRPHDGTRRGPQLEAMHVNHRPAVLNSDDVLVVTGGAKGIGAECALALARQTGVKLGLIGRGDPDKDAAVAASLTRMTAAGARFCYVRADVTAPDAVGSAIERITSTLGPVTGVLYAAGVNQPALLADMSDEEMRQPLAVKATGARNLLKALEGQPLRLFVAFGSLIGRTGMRGDAHYAQANEALRLFVDELGVSRSECRCLTIEWSVWAGAGMGDRLGRLSALERQGIVPLTVDQGVGAFVDLVLHSDAAGSVVVSSRFGHIPGLELAGPSLPLARFLEKPRVWYPGIELVADADLSIDTDPYLADHVLEGERVFPAVLGLEAMIQAAAALRGLSPGTAWELRDVTFKQPIVVSGGGRRMLRVAALARGDDDVDVVLRCDATGFAVDHFAARCRPTVHEEPAAERPVTGDVAPAAELYNELLFQRGRFQRVGGYRQLRARACVAEIAAAAVATYFSSFHASSLWLGDPGARDAMVHAIQACIPTRRLVPVRVNRLTVFATETTGQWAEAVERAQHGETYVYDVDIRDASGRLVERWEGLHLRDIGGIVYEHGVPAVLLEPWLEREWIRAVPDADVQFVQLPVERHGSGLAAVNALVPALRRPDGRPEPVRAGLFASATHDSGRTVGMAADVPIGCDLERVSHRADVEWHRLLGASDSAVARHVMNAAGESLDVAATRVWCAREALGKSGLGVSMPLVLDECEAPVLRFRAGAHVVTTARLRRSETDSVFAMVVPKAVAA